MLHARSPSVPALWFLSGPLVTLRASGAISVNGFNLV